MVGYFDLIVSVGEETQVPESEETWQIMSWSNSPKSSAQNLTSKHKIK